MIGTRERTGNKKRWPLERFEPPGAPTSERERDSDLPFAGLPQGHRGAPPSNSWRHQRRQRRQHRLPYPAHGRCSRAPTRPRFRAERCRRRCRPVRRRGRGGRDHHHARGGALLRRRFWRGRIGLGGRGARGRLLARGRYRRVGWLARRRPLVKSRGEGCVRSLGAWARGSGTVTDLYWY